MNTYPVPAYLTTAVNEWLFKNPTRLAHLADDAPNFQAWKNLAAMVLQTREPSESMHAALDSWATISEYEYANAHPHQRALLLLPGQPLSFVTLTSTAPAVVGALLGLPASHVGTMSHEDGSEPEGLTIYCSGAAGSTLPHNALGEQAAEYIFGDLCEVSGPLLIVPTPA